MLARVSLLLAQAVRQRQPLLCCEVSTTELLEAVVEAAEQHNRPTILTIQFSTTRQLQSAELLLAVAHWKAEQVKVKIGIEVRLSSLLLPELPKLLQEWRAYPLFAVALPMRVEWPNSSRSIERIGIVTARQNVEILEATVHQRDLQALRMPEEKAAIELRELTRRLRVPIILEENTYTPAELRAIGRTGVASISLGDQLQASFTAGVRAGLRNREVRDAELYLGRGKTAVRERVGNYFKYL